MSPGGVIFVSYSRRDVSAADALVAELRRLGATVWIDRTDIPNSVPWMAEIVGAIRRALLVVQIATPDWHQSATCQDEARAASSLDKTVVTWLPQDGVPAAVEAIGDALERLTEPEVLRARVLGQSFRWDRAGRSSDQLASAALTKRLGKVSERDEPDPVAWSFVAASVRRMRRRRWVRRLLIALLVSLVGANLVVQKLPDAVNNVAQDNLRTRANLRQASAFLETQSWEGLRRVWLASGAAEVSEWEARMLLAPALALALPTRITGHADQGGAYADGLRPGSRVRGRDHVATLGENHHVVLTAADGSRIGDLPAWGHVTALAWSSGDRWLAMADESGIHVVEPGAGELLLLRGLDGRVASLEWTDETTIVGRSPDGLTATWTVRQHVTELQSSERRFVAAEASSDGSAVVAVDRSGELVSVSGDRVTPLPTTAGSGDGIDVLSWGDDWLVLRKGTEGTGNLVVQGSGRVINLPDCTPTALATGPDLAGAGTVAVACLESTVLLVVVGTGSLKRVELQVQPMSVTVVGNRIILGSYYGEIDEVVDGRERGLIGEYLSGCTYGATVVAASPDGRLLFNAGAAAAECSLIRSIDGSDEMNHVVPREGGFTSVRSGVWSRTQSQVVIGMASGSVAVHDVHLGTVTTMLPISVSPVRALALTGDETVLAFTAAGEVLRVDLSESLAPIPQLRHVIGEELDMAIAAGLAAPQ